MARAPETVIRLTSLPPGKSATISYRPNPSAVDEIRGRLDLLGLRKMRLEGTLTPLGRRDWQLDAELGATVVQPCAITLDPVTTRIDETLTRRYLADWAPPAEAEAEIPEDDSAEALPDVLDIAALAEEALALALPPFPRADGAALGEMSATPPGAAPIGEEEAEKPFAGLADLKKRLEGPNGE
ncbi:MAG: DUF177 domain-containing protein [Pseudomonadota bacterium]